MNQEHSVKLDLIVLTNRIQLAYEREIAHIAPIVPSEKCSSTKFRAERYVDDSIYADTNNAHWEIIENNLGKGAGRSKPVKFYKSSMPALPNSSGQIASKWMNWAIWA